MKKSKFILNVFIFILSEYLFGVFFILLIGINKKIRTIDYDWKVALVNVLVFLLLLLLLKKYIKKYIEKLDFSIKKIGIYFLLGVIYAFISNFIYFAFSINAFSFNPINAHKFSYIISVVLIAPFVEEIIYRVIPIEYLIKKNVTKIWIVSFTSLFFGLVHLPNFSQFFFTFFLGLICSLVYIKERNLIYPILIHFIYNLFSIFIG